MIGLLRKEIKVDGLLWLWEFVCKNSAVFHSVRLEMGPFPVDHCFPFFVAESKTFLLMALLHWQELRPLKLKWKLNA